MFWNRTTASILLTLIFLAAFAEMSKDGAPSEKVTGVLPELFWLDKLGQLGVYDVVIAGDSRVITGVAPEEMEQVLGLRACNYGFAGMGLEQQYLEKMASLFRSGEGSQRIIVLSITPHSLTPKASKANGFREWQHAQISKSLSPGWFGVQAERIMGEVLQKRFARQTPREALEILGVVSPLRVRWYDYRPSGWLATDQQPRDPDEAYSAYRELFTGNRVDPQIVAGVIDRVRAWRGQRFEVFGVRLPVSESIKRMEEKYSGLDWNDFLRSFTCAGGIWLGDFSRERRYETYDGNHLSADSAIDFSRDLAQAILAQRSKYAATASHRPSTPMQSAEGKPLAQNSSGPAAGPAPR